MIFSSNFKYFIKAAFIKERTYDHKIIGRDHGWVLGND